MSNNQYQNFTCLI